MNGTAITIENGVVSVPASGDVWMTQHEIARLFGCFVAKVNANVRSVLKGEVLDEQTVCRTHRYRDGGGMTEYNLEMIVALAFRIRSPNADLFQAWMMKRAVVGTGANSAQLRLIVIVGGWSREKHSDLN